MKEAYKKYFNKLKENYQETFNSKPTVPYSKSYDKKLIVSDKDSEDYIQWEPVYLDGRFNFTKIEQKLGFEICSNLKEFYSTCLFCELRGSFEEKELIFSPILSRKNLMKHIEQNFKDGQWLIPNSEVFLIGDACVNGNDNCFICFDNSNKNLFIYDNEKNRYKKIKLPSLSNVIANMEPSFIKTL